MSATETANHFPPEEADRLLKEKFQCLARLRLRSEPPASFERGANAALGYRLQLQDGSTLVVSFPRWEILLRRKAFRPKEIVEPVDTFAKSLTEAIHAQTKNVGIVRLCLRALGAIRLLCSANEEAARGVAASDNASSAKKT